MSKGIKKGVLLINLGTPDSPAVKDVRKFHNRFFSDPRVIDTSWIGRQLLKYAVILPFRSPAIAKTYKEIWTDKGSPLLYYGKQVQEGLQQKLGADYIVELGMGYSSPSVGVALNKLKKEGVDSIKVIPLFPQYASATTGSVTEAVMTEVKAWEVIPEMDFVSSFYDHPAFINAWAERGSKYDLNSYDHIIFSYHGLPERHIQKADSFDYCLKGSCCESINHKNHHCYRAQCYATTYQIASQSGLDKNKLGIAFQSRFGKTPWLQPYLDDYLIDQIKKGNKKVLVFAPSFVADCIETVDEIGVEYRELFLEKGGEQLDLVESLNDHPSWIEALFQLIRK